MKEADIKRVICEWLALQKGCFFWIQSAGKIPGRKNTSRFQRNGIADILGIWKGRPMASEVKMPEGRVSEEQKEFLARFAAEGGISIIAKTLDDVTSVLQLL
jgi:hypothetical protein